MAPEQAEGKPVDCRADIYSFGVTCYHMLAGEPPFRGATAVEVALQHITGEAAPLTQVRPDLPPALCTIVHRTMAKRPGDRFQTAREVLREIARLRDGTTALVPVPTTGSSVDVVPVTSAVAVTVADDWPSRRWPRWLVATLAVLGIALGGLAGALAGRVWHPASAPATRTASGDPGDVDQLPVEDEPALRRTAEIYVAAGQSRDVSVGMSLCTKLALLYLEQHRLDEADKLFARLENAEKVNSYRTFGKLGRAMVLALQSKAEESNKLFRDVAALVPQRDAVTVKGTPRRPDPEMVKVFQNPAFLYWLAQSVHYNHVNGVPDDQVPPALRRLLELKGHT
jgi:serine/threonine-protein kinase